MRISDWASDVCSSDLGSLKVLKILSRASAVIAEGEVNQLSAQRRIETSEDQYLAIINAKTAELFAAARKVAAVVAERDERSQERRVGTELVSTCRYRGPPVSQKEKQRTCYQTALYRISINNI